MWWTASFFRKLLIGLLDSTQDWTPGFLSTSLAPLDCELQETWTSFTAVSPGLNSAWHMVDINRH